VHRESGDGQEENEDAGGGDEDGDDSEHLNSTSRAPRISECLRPPWADVLSSRLSTELLAHVATTLLPSRTSTSIPLPHSSATAPPIAACSTCMPPPSIVVCDQPLNRLVDALRGCEEADAEATLATLVGSLRGLMRCGEQQEWKARLATRFEMLSITVGLPDDVCVAHFGNLLPMVRTFNSHTLLAILRLVLLLVMLVGVIGRGCGVVLT
jgi:hypothetical protein